MAGFGNMRRRPRLAQRLRRRPSLGRRRSFGGGKIRLIIALVMGLSAVFSYFTSTQVNEVTGEKQHLRLTKPQEIALGRQAVPAMARQHGGLHPDENAQAVVDRVGERLVSRSDAAGQQWAWDFHLLADPRAVNAFALPGGQVFITAALYNRLEAESQLAGVMGHEIAHVIARHGAERMAKSDLTRGLAGAVGVASGTAGGAQMAQMIGQMVNMKYGRDDELESDRLGVRFMSQAGYDPRGMVGVMEILANASGSRERPEFSSTHPNPDRRIERIEEAIRETFPNGIPADLDR